ncbi:hypothetical protein D8674_035249 [Pyrus ussuriensis x Pyrus communis]|uniref:Uncharacterized protein n=1 Tax=Pyrus ussuriensis x Pyrus communis TaxID=2448454 RepID=A0A5N5GCP7_9ROSA|nr:hypothetical protein D8674_035249 [Pyrus ussuriensis x Pyrus communis]
MTKAIVNKPAEKVPPAKKIRLEHALRPLPLNVKPKEHPQKHNSHIQCVDESEDGKLPLPSVNNGISSTRGFVSQESHYRQYSSNAPSASGPIIKPVLWCLQPPPEIYEYDPFFGGHSYGPENQLSLREVNFTRQVRHCHTKTVQASKGSDLQGSTRSSPSDRTTENVLPLFPIAPQLQEHTQKAQSSEHQTRDQGCSTQY